MKNRLLLFVAAGMLVASGTAVWVLACDKEAKSNASAAASHSTCTAAMAAQCTAAQAAACKAKGMSAVTAGAQGMCPYSHGATAVAADTKGSCAAHGATAVTADAKGSCAAHGATAVTADAKGSCAAHGAKVSAVAAGSGYSCGGRGRTAAADRFAHADCDACADMNACDGELKASGAMTQTVKLKNGIMYIYTAHDPSKVRAVQAAVAQRNERLASIRSEKAKLCPDCKLMRGAMASGKMSREMVAIDGGCLTLVTSSDPVIVNKLHAMAETHAAGNHSARAKI